MGLGKQLLKIGLISPVGHLLTWIAQVSPMHEQGYDLVPSNYVP